MKATSQPHNTEHLAHRIPQQDAPSGASPAPNVSARHPDAATGDQPGNIVEALRVAAETNQQRIA